MTVMQSGGGRALASGSGKVLLWRPLRTGTTTTPPVIITSAGNPGAIPGIAGWWDAGTLATLLSGTGNPVAAPGSTVATLKDISATSAALVPYHFSGAAPTVATARVSGLLGATAAFATFAGIGLNLPAPVLDADTGLSAGNRNLGSGTAWTVYLTWSRPNYRRTSAGFLSGPITLLRIGSTNILQVDGQDGSGRLVLFPGAGQSVLSSAMAGRHTHSIVLRNTPGAGIDVWLDDSSIASAAPNPLPAAFGAPLTLLHDQTGATGSAQCYFHEAAIFTAAIATSYVANLLSYATRWARGARKCIGLVISGQSNAGNALNDGGPTLLAQGAAWHLGALAWNAIGNYGSAPHATCIGGHGITNVPFSGPVTLGASFLADPEDSSDPAGWALGTDGLSVQNFLQSDTSASDLADVKAIVWPWSESDSVHPYSDKTFFTNAVTNLIGKERGMIPGANAANTPLIVWNAMPFNFSNNDGGMQMHREVVAAMVANTPLNTWVGNPMTADTAPRGSTVAATGISTGGDGFHLDSIDNIRLAREAAPVVARAILASSGGDTLGAIPAGVPAVGGPRITHAYRASNTSVILTVTHDAGNDLVVALQALNGAGFCVMDGGTTAAPGFLRFATACARVDATHLQVTLGTPLFNASSACSLFYPYGTNTIGRGDCVTDNYASVAPPIGWNIGGDLGSSWTLNFPLAATLTPIVLSDTP